jgi:hypothetical protein
MSTQGRIVSRGNVSHTVITLKQQFADCPICRADEATEDALSVVCGSDGHTYSSRCQLERAACLKDEQIRLVAEGECQPQAQEARTYR